MLKNIKSQKGVTGLDIGVAIFIIIIFSSLIASLFYNISMINTSKKRNAIAAIYATEVLEEVGKMNYDEISEELLKQHISEKYLNLENVNVQDYNGNYEVNGYTITMEVTKYNETYGEKDGIPYDNRYKEDVIKIVNVKVEYKVGKNIDFIEISRIKTKEI